MQPLLTSAPRYDIMMLSRGVGRFTLPSEGRGFAVRAAPVTRTDKDARSRPFGYDAGCEMGRPIKDRVGKRYGRLTALECIGYDKRQNAVWRCSCDCGNMTKVCGSDLERPQGRGSKSCGCLCKEINSRLHRIHGMEGTKEYRAWRSMKTRCFLPNHPAYKNYGARGITVCDRWMHSFANFFVDMGLAPESGRSLDRINNDGNYEPGNCRWATRSQQRRNRRVNQEPVAFGK